MYSKDFSKIYNQNIEVTKVLHKNLLVWSSGFDGDFSKPELWEMGSINSSGSPYSNANEARTKDFFEVPESGLTVLNLSQIVGKIYRFEIYFYQDKIHSTYISRSYSGNSFPQKITVPNNAEYYKLVFYNGVGAHRYPFNFPEAIIEANIKIVPTPDVYLAKDSDFVKVNGYWVYRGSELEVEIPTHINEQLVTSTAYMFSGSSTYQATPVTKVVLKHSNVTNMSNMFAYSSATTLDLSSFNTSKVTDMGNMFYGSKATTLDLSSFNTSNVTNMISMFNKSSATTLDLSSFNTSNVITMGSMFSSSSATTLDLSSFNTSNVTNMGAMFSYSSATTLDLSSFDTSNVTNVTLMFSYSSATTGYARTQADANKLNASYGKPTGLNFVVKP